MPTPRPRRSQSLFRAFRETFPGGCSEGKFARSLTAAAPAHTTLRMRLVRDGV